VLAQALQTTGYIVGRLTPLSLLEATSLVRKKREKGKMQKWIKDLKRFARNKKAISGLESAIVLIAFVIVASAFAYAVLNMGFLATQKTQEVVVGGLQAASSAVVMDGPVYGYGNNTSGLTTVMFWLKTASGADAVDMNPGKLAIGFQNDHGVWPNIWVTSDTNVSIGGTTYIVNKNATTLKWEIGTSYLLERNEKVRVTIDLKSLYTDTDPNAGLVTSNEQFKIIVKPPLGSVLDIVRYAPAEVKAVNDLG
jgi:flagellin FlaB